MFALNTSVAFLLHQVVDAVAAALARAGEATTTHHHRNFVGPNAVPFHHVQDGTFAVLELVGHFGKLLYLLDGVRQIFGKHFVLTIVDGSFG